MAKYNHGFGISFNDNDGGASWFSTGEGMDEYTRYAKQMGWLRARVFFFRKFWIALKHVESFTLRNKKVPAWKSLRGWKP